MGLLFLCCEYCSLSAQKENPQALTPAEVGYDCGQSTTRCLRIGGKIMKRTCATLLVCLGAVSILSPRAGAQDRNSSAWRECQSRASSAMRVSTSDVEVTPGGDTDRGRYILN